jgi:NAD(P)-dependent dehydrogenase (short-subunit alcohol dehydrogenase family)
MTDGVRAERLRSIPLGRPEEVAFLAGHRASYVTGQVIGVDGALVV